MTQDSKHPQIKRTVSLLLSLLLCVACIAPLMSEAHAAMADEATHYELGERYTGRIINGVVSVERYYKFYIPAKSHVSISTYGDETYDKSEIVYNLYNASGKKVLSDDDIIYTHNNATGKISGKQYRVLNKGTYYLGLRALYSRCYYSFAVQAEPQINLTKGIITSLQCPAKGKMTVKMKAAKNAIGYRIQYSVYPNFKTFKTVNSPSTTKTITGLQKGKSYYVRIAPYTVYGDGTYVHGQNSLPKRVYIKK